MGDCSRSQELPLVVRGNQLLILNFELLTMIPNFAETVFAVAPYIPAKLISGKNLRHIIAIASQLPGALASFWGFECRLGEEAPQGDFLLSVKAEEEGRAIVAGTHDNIKLSESLRTNPVWNLACNFSQHWLDPTSPIYNKVDNIWLEFDVNGEPPPIPIPSLFFGCSPAQVENTGITLAKAEPESHQWVTETALKILLGDSLSGKMKQKLWECLVALPTDAYVFQIGMMLGRKSDLIRLCVRNISPEDIIVYLEQIGWTGSIDFLQTTISELASFAARIDLDLDVGNSVLPKIGLECYLEGQPRSEPKWQAFLSYLVEKALCLPDKKDALMGCPRYISVSSEKLGARKWSGFVRGLHHIKIVGNGERVIEAKGYIYINHSWLVELT